MNIQAQAVAASLDLGRQAASKILGSRESIVAIAALGIIGYVSVSAVNAGAFKDAAYGSFAAAVVAASLIWGLSWRKAKVGLEVAEDISESLKKVDLAAAEPVATPDPKLAADVVNDLVRRGVIAAPAAPDPLA